jgi:hypothetical protein
MAVLDGPRKASIIGHCETECATESDLVSRSDVDVERPHMFRVVFRQSPERVVRQRTEFVTSGPFCDLLQLRKGQNAF